MRKIGLALGPLALLLAVLAYHKSMARLGAGPAPVMAVPVAQADAIKVFKAQRQMVLLRDGAELARYDVSLGGKPVGHKRQEGDERTPEGQYVIDWRNAHSVAHLSLHISYPNAQDKAQAQADGVSAGGNIMIHGLPNGWGFLGRLHRLLDWTDGCIGVTNAEMDEIWSRVDTGTPITLYP